MSNNDSDIKKNEKIKDIINKLNNGVISYEEAIKESKKYGVELKL